MNVMIVDDSESVRKFLKHIVQQISVKLDLTFNVVEACDGSEAELILQKAYVIGEPIEFVFLDWNMPVMSGFDFLQKIRSTVVYKEKPNVAIVTAETSIQELTKAFDYNIARFIIKPFKLEQIEEVLMMARTPAQIKKGAA